MLFIPPCLHSAATASFFLTVFNILYHFTDMPPSVTMSTLPAGSPPLLLTLLPLRWHGGLPSLSLSLCLPPVCTPPLSLPPMILLTLPAVQAFSGAWSSSSSSSSGDGVSVASYLPTLLLQLLVPSSPLPPVARPGCGC